jgi:hypothetical protein
VLGLLLLFCAQKILWKFLDLTDDETSAPAHSDSQPVATSSLPYASLVPLNRSNSSRIPMIPLRLVE